VKRQLIVCWSIEWKILSERYLYGYVDRGGTNLSRIVCTGRVVMPQASKVGNRKRGAGNRLVNRKKVIFGNKTFQIYVGVSVHGYFLNLEKCGDQKPSRPCSDDVALPSALHVISHLISHL